MRACVRACVHACACVRVRVCNAHGYSNTGFSMKSAAASCHPLPRLQKVWSRPAAGHCMSSIDLQPVLHACRADACQPAATAITDKKASQAAMASGNAYGVKYGCHKGRQLCSSWLTATYGQGTAAAAISQRLMQIELHQATPSPRVARCASIDRKQGRCSSKVASQVLTWRAGGLGCPAAAATAVARQWHAHCVGA